jgi:hypothetical protein
MTSEGGGAREAKRGRRSEGGGARKQVWAGAGAEANRGWQVDGPEQIEAERMGGSGDGRWASSSSIADTRGCGVVCCVLCVHGIVWRPVYVLGKGGLHYVLTFFVSTCSHIVSTCSHIVSTCSQINVSKCEPENYTLNFLQLSGLKNVYTFKSTRAGPTLESCQGVFASPKVKPKIVHMYTRMYLNVNGTEIYTDYTRL